MVIFPSCKSTTHQNDVIDESHWWSWSNINYDKYQIVWMDMGMRLPRALWDKTVRLLRTSVANHR